MTISLGRVGFLGEAGEGSEVELPDKIQDARLNLNFRLTMSKFFFKGISMSQILPGINLY